MMNMIRPLQIIQKVLNLAPAVWFAAVAGTTMHGTAGRLFVSSSGPTAATALLAFALPGQLVLDPWSLVPLAEFFEGSEKIKT